ncbi:MAG: ABC transporter ATP-binding protein [Nitrososphaerales archaeon]
MKIVEFSNFSFSYDNGNYILKDMNFYVEEGWCVLVAGKSGCGKSTLLRCINGLIPKYYKGRYEGEVLVDGVRVIDYSMSELSKKVGTLFQNPDHQLFMFSVEREIAFGLENLGLDPSDIKDRVEWALDFLNLKDLAKRAPYELSEGQKQRVALASILVMRPKIILLDEPTSLLDPKTSLQLVNLLRNLKEKLKVTLIIAEHKLELFSPIADRLLVVHDGSIKAYHRVKEVLKNPSISSYGVSLPPLAQLSLFIEGFKEPSLTIDEMMKELRRFFNDRVS